MGTEFTDTEAASRLYTRDRRAAEIAGKGKGKKVKNL